ncbi:MAG: S-adenosylmethionine tRNA ribosyltransferase [Flammeovirgaceae bacterium]|nr:S-adenosylmethionine tRNA ribosyltransferase [Flammeovirgaceae bacterium]
MDIKEIHPKNFNYLLPKESIAQIPLKNRSDSKLLHYQKGSLAHYKFSALPELIKNKSLIIFNDTKVIPARMIFHKATGARIEIFLLEPLKPTVIMEEIMSSKGSCSWVCMIGNAKKWTNDIALSIKTDHIQLTAKRLSHDTVQFSWPPEKTWSELLLALGKLPLPPYISRAPTGADKNWYQTVYSKLEGAVAAPTAGLHFTKEILNKLRSKHQIDYLTLHVSAGTFQPIKTNAADHQMHREQLRITRSNLINLLNNESVIAVGTTSMRSLESIYWYGVKLINGEHDFFISKMYPYQDYISLPDKKMALSTVLKYMDSLALNTLTGHTEIFIFPGYKFKIVNKIITNFHMPGTTLIMLIAAFCGPDWEKIYKKALKHNYRFLSYGDSSYLEPALEKSHRNDRSKAKK